MLPSERVRTGYVSQAESLWQGRLGAMSLRSALETLPSDRGTLSAVREIVALFARHPGEWTGVDRIATVTEVQPDIVRRVLTVLSSSFVLDSDDDSERYCYQSDALLDLEIKRYLRRIDTHSNVLRSNVEEFRRRYGEH